MFIVKPYSLFRKIISLDTKNCVREMLCSQESYLHLPANIKCQKTCALVFTVKEAYVVNQQDIKINIL